MKLLATDLLNLTRELSPLLSAGGFALGLFLWSFGAATHRFWLALLVTLTAGVAGLQLGPYYDIQPLVAGLLLALAAGALALSLVRVLLFVMGGVVALVLVRTLNAGWNELVCFVCGGLAGVFLYRWWITVLSSFTGSLLMVYAALSLLDRLGKLQSVPWAEKNWQLLDWGIAVLTLMGILVQFLLHRRRQRRDKGKGKGKGPPFLAANAAPHAGPAGGTPPAAAALAPLPPHLAWLRYSWSWIPRLWRRLPWQRVPRIRVVWPGRT
jgi:hypothetical protein